MTVLFLLLSLFGNIFVWKYIERNEKNPIVEQENMLFTHQVLSDSTAEQAPLSFTVSWSLLKFMAIESVEIEKTEKKSLFGVLGIAIQETDSGKTKRIFQGRAGVRDLKRQKS